MSQLGWAKAQHYSWEKVSRRVLSYYHSVLHTCGVVAPECEEIGLRVGETAAPLRAPSAREAFQR